MSALVCTRQGSVDSCNIYLGVGLVPNPSSLKP
jgi:hypothetical protein